MNPLYISAFVADFTDYEKLEHLVRNAPAPVGVELGTSWKTADFQKRLSENAFRFAGLPVTLHAPFTEICTVPHSEEERRMRELFAGAVTRYHQFHASSMVVHTHEKTAGKDLDWARERSRQVLTCLAEQADAEGVSLAVENVGYPAKNNALFDLPQFVELVESLPEKMGCLIDVGHALCNGWDVPVVIRRLGPRIRGYHLHTNDGAADRHWPIYHPRSMLGREGMDEILEAIAQVTPQAHLVLEYSPRCGVTQEELYSDLTEIRMRCW